jgi:hypothetical protein
LIAIQVFLDGALNRAQPVTSELVHSHVLFPLKEEPLEFTTYNKRRVQVSGEELDCITTVVDSKAKHSFSSLRSCRVLKRVLVKERMSALDFSVWLISQPLCGTLSKKYHAYMTKVSSVEDAKRSGQPLQGQSYLYDHGTPGTYTVARVLAKEEYEASRARQGDVWNRVLLNVGREEKNGEGGGGGALDGHFLSVQLIEHANLYIDGFPHELRAMLWSCLASVQVQQIDYGPTYYRSLLEQGQSASANSLKQKQGEGGEQQDGNDASAEHKAMLQERGRQFRTIAVDVPRTFTRHPDFRMPGRGGGEQKGERALSSAPETDVAGNAIDSYAIGEQKAAENREKLTRVLQAWTVHNPTVGYTQSMSMIAAALLLLFDEEHSFWMFSAFMTQIMPANYYKDGLMDARVDMLLINDLVREELPLLHHHLHKLQVQLEMITFQCLMCAFSERLPLESMYRVWDVLLVEGSTFLISTMLGMLHVYQDELISIDSTLELLDSMRVLGNDLHDSDLLMERAVLMHSRVGLRVPALRAEKLEALVAEEVEQKRLVESARQKKTFELKSQAAVDAEREPAAAAADEGGPDDLEQSRDYVLLGLYDRAFGLARGIEEEENAFGGSYNTEAQLQTHLLALDAFERALALETDNERKTVLQRESARLQKRAQLIETTLANPGDVCEGTWETLAMPAYVSVLLEQARFFITAAQAHENSAVHAVDQEEDGFVNIIVDSDSKHSRTNNPDIPSSSSSSSSSQQPPSLVLALHCYQQANVRYVEILQHLLSGAEPTVWDPAFSQLEFLSSKELSSTVRKVEARIDSLKGSLQSWGQYLVERKEQPTPDGKARDDSLRTRLRCLKRKIHERHRHGLVDLEKRALVVYVNTEERVRQGLLSASMKANSQWHKSRLQAAKINKEASIIVGDTKFMLETEANNAKNKILSFLGI